MSEIVNAFEMTALTANFGLSPFQFGAVLLIYLMGAIVKGGLGFGMPLVSVAMLPLVVPVEMALALNAFLLIVINLIQFIGSGHMIESVRRFWPMLGGHLIGIPIGASLLAVIATDTLTLALGLFVLLFVYLSFTNPSLRVPPSQEKPVSGLVGMAAGCVGALTSSPGPIYVMFLVGLNLERGVFFGVLAVNLLIVGVLVSLSYAAIGLMTAERLVLATLCIVPALAGMWIGNQITRRIPQELFKRIVLIFLVLLGLNLIFRSFVG